MAKINTQKAAHEVIAESLREFGYPDATADMIREVHEAMRPHQSSPEVDLPHGVVGLFAESQIKEAWEFLEALPLTSHKGAK